MSGLSPICDTNWTRATLRKNKAIVCTSPLSDEERATTSLNIVDDPSTVRANPLLPHHHPPLAPHRRKSRNAAPQPPSSAAPSPRPPSSGAPGGPSQETTLEVVEVDCTSEVSLAERERRSPAISYDRPAPKRKSLTIFKFFFFPAIFFF